MLAKVHSFVLVGIDPLHCEVEADVSQRGMSKTTIVGLAQTAVRESIERVRRAMLNSGFAFPAHSVLINLAPADVKKDGPALDLAIAIGLLRGSGFIKGDKHREYCIAGELALDGRLRRIKGALSMALMAKHRGLKGVIVPQDNAREAAVVEGIDVIAIENLGQALSFFNDQLPMEPYQLNGEPYAASAVAEPLDFADVRGQEAVKRAITIAAAGSHNLLTLCPVRPGTVGATFESIGMKHRTRTG